jgi:hypothetical protein
MLRTSIIRTIRPIRQAPAFGRLYHEKVIDHYERPRNVGSLPKNDLDVGTGLYSPILSTVSGVEADRVESEHQPVEM